MQGMNRKVSAETTDTSEAERVADVLAGRTEDLAVDLDLAVATERVAPTVPTDGPGDRVLPGFPDPLVEVEVADRMRHDG
jgi:hypothetical protein